MGAEATFRFTVNGRERSVATDPDRSLLEVLREDFGLTGTKYGCGEGQCGACSVLVEGRRMYACRTAVSKVEGKAVVTIEGGRRPVRGGSTLGRPVRAALRSWCSHDQVAVA